jgi:transcriptional regulator with XRE-family HTH domain
MRSGNAPSITASTSPPDRIRTPVATTSSSSVAAARELIASRLREILRDAGMTSRAVALAAGWDESKCSRLLHGRTPPSDQDIRDWCTICGVPEEIPNLIAASRNAESAYLEFRRVKRSQKRMQVLRTALYEDARLYRFYSSNVVPWPLQTAGYIRAVMETFNRFHDAGNTDISEGVQERLIRQRRYLGSGERRCELVIEESVLYDRSLGAEVMRDQLGYLLAGSRRPGMSLGVLARGGSRDRYAAESFSLYGDAAVVIETVSAIITITQPREIALYTRFFSKAADSAVYDGAARELIADALAALD